MDQQPLKIEQFNNILYANDKKGRTVFFASRPTSCFIITLKGKVKFTLSDMTVITDHTQGIFIPKGATYTNECLENAESIVINFDTAEPISKPRTFKSINEKSAMHFYENIRNNAFKKTESAQYYLLSQLYSVAQQLFRTDEPKNTKEVIAENAYYFIQKEFFKPSLQIPDVARHCHISAFYLRKIFNEIYNKTPFEVLTDIRMEKAHEMLLEKRPVKETAFSVGYSDVYQFSRAYKRYFGVSPTTTLK